MPDFHFCNTYYSDSHFQYERKWYETDPYNGRFYVLMDSSNMRPEMDGALVRRRISKSLYTEKLNSLKELLEKRRKG